MAGKVALGAPPDSSQGYGRVTLKNVLPLQNVYIFDLFVEDLVSIAPYTTIRYTILLGAYATSVPIKFVVINIVICCICIELFVFFLL